MDYVHMHMNIYIYIYSLAFITHIYISILTCNSFFFSLECMFQSLVVSAEYLSNSLSFLKKTKIIGKIIFSKNIKVIKVEHIRKRLISEISLLHLFSIISFMIPKEMIQRINQIKPESALRQADPRLWIIWAVFCPQTFAVAVSLPQTLFPQMHAWLVTLTSITFYWNLPFFMRLSLTNLREQHSEEYFLIYLPCFLSFLYHLLLLNMPDVLHFYPSSPPPLHLFC